MACSRLTGPPQPQPVSQGTGTCITLALLWEFQNWKPRMKIGPVTEAVTDQTCEASALLFLSPKGWSRRGRHRGERQRASSGDPQVSTLFRPFRLKGVSWILVTCPRPRPAPTCPVPPIPEQARQPEKSKAPVAVAGGAPVRLSPGLLPTMPRAVHCLFLGPDTSQMPHPSAGRQVRQGQEWVA